MNSRLLQGGTRRRNRRMRTYRDTGPRGPRPPGRTTWTWLGLAVLVVVAGAAAAWYFAIRPNGHRGTAAAAQTSAHPAARARHAALPTGPYTGPPGITLASRNVLPVHFGDPPRAGLVFDLDTGRTLWQLRPLQRVPIASLTKIISAIIIVDHTNPTEKAPVTSEALHYQGQALGELPPHKSVPVEGLLAGMLLTSANDAAIDLADYVAGSDAGFAALMNRTATHLGLRCSHFVSAYGLQTGNQSCAADLAALARIAMSKPRIADFARQPQAKVPFPIKGGFLYVTSTNPLYAQGYPGTIGLKTGFTDAAGECLVAIVRRGGHTYGAVLLNSPDTAGQAEKLLDSAFAHT